MIDLTEFNKLTTELEKRGLDIIVVDLFDGKQVICGQWDAIIHRGSYGHEEGLLEVYGMAYLPSGEVEGYLTADDVLERLYNPNFNKCNEDGDGFASMRAMSMMM